MLIAVGCADLVVLFVGGGFLIGNLVLLCLLRFWVSIVGLDWVWIGCLGWVWFCFVLSGFWDLVCSLYLVI